VFAKKKRWKNCKSGAKVAKQWQKFLSKPRPIVENLPASAEILSLPR